MLRRLDVTEGLDWRSVVDSCSVHSVPHCFLPCRNERSGRWRAQQSAWWTLAVPRLTTSTTAPLCRHGITARLRSYSVRIDSRFTPHEIIPSRDPPPAFDCQSEKIICRSPLKCQSFILLSPFRTGLEPSLWCVEHRLHPIWILPRLHPVSGAVLSCF